MQVHALASGRARMTVAVRAAIYARVSSDQQAERHTIDSRVEALLARAAADGHEIRAELRWPPGATIRSTARSSGAGARSSSPSTTSRSAPRCATTHSPERERCLFP